MSTEHPAHAAGSGSSQTGSSDTGSSDTGSSRKTLVLAAMIFAVAMTFIDQTIVSIAVPKIESELNLSINGVQWVVNGYLLALAAMFAFGGRLSDMIGHRRMVVIGVVVFALSSVACGFTPKGSFAEAWIVIWRIVQGAGGAIMYPAALAIVVSAFPVRERGRAMAIFFGVAGGLTAIGPLLGGYLSEWTWRAIFWVNVPVAIIALVLTAIARPVTQTRPGRMDVRGLVLISGGVGLAIFGLQQTQVWGWRNVTTIACMAAGAVLLVLFTLAELRERHPLIQVRTFMIRAFLVENIVLFTAMIVFIPVFFFASVYAQVALGYTSQNAGLYLLCFFAGFAPGAQIGGRRLDKVGAKEIVVAGCVISLAGFVLWAHTATQLSLGHQWYFIVLAGLGMGMMLGPANTDAINQVGRLSYGEATGVTQTVRNFGSSFGLAALGTLLITVERSNLVSRLEKLGLPSAAPHSAATSLSSTRGSSAPPSVPAALARNVFHAARLSLADGMRAVLYGMAVAMAIAAVVAAVGLRRGIHTAADRAGGDQASGDQAGGDQGRGDQASGGQTSRDPATR
jgi:EmrB/QacA subfamily drug resistance transporter